MHNRKEVRRSVIIPTDVSSPYWRDSLDLVAADLSPRGMYLLSDEMPGIGDMLFCSFSLDSEDPEYYFFGKVRRINWHRRKSDRVRPGFGVEFIDPSSNKALALKKALRGMPPPIPSKRGEDARWRAPLQNNVHGEGLTFASRWYWGQTNRRILSLG